MRRVRLAPVVSLLALIQVATVVVNAEPKPAPVCNEEDAAKERTLKGSSTVEGDEKKFKLDPDSSLVQYLNPAIFQNETYVAEIRRRLHNHELVVVYDAFVTEFAEHMWNDLISEDISWRLHEEFLEDGFSYSHHNVYEPEDYTTVMNQTMDIFEHHDTKEWIGDLSGRDVGGYIQGSASNYFDMDYSLPHTDDINGRTVAFVWHLSHNWLPEWGGALYWCGEPNGQHASVPASFNTLHLFSVTRYTNHFVTSVSRHAMEERLTFNGWWTYSEDDFITEADANRLPELYPTYNDRLHLTSVQATEILSWSEEHMNDETKEWTLLLRTEIDDDPRVQSYVIDLKDRRTEHWKVREQWEEYRIEEGNRDGSDKHAPHDEEEQSPQQATS